MRCHYKIFLQGLEFYVVEVEIFKNKFLMNDSKETVLPIHNRTDMHMKYDKHEQDLYKFKEKSYLRKGVVSKMSCF